MNLVLASNSPRRKEILDQRKISFTVTNPEYEENLDVHGDPRVETMNAALGKALSVRDSLAENQVILCADTIVYLESILGKPSSEQEAREMLRKLSGRDHEVITGFAMCSHSGQLIVDYETTRVKFRALTEEDITWYISTGEPMDKAGAYGIQGKASIFIESVTGDYENVVGLPFSRITKYFDMFKVVRSIV